MSVLIDTSVLIDHLRADPRAVRLLKDLFADNEGVWAATPTRTEILAGIRDAEMEAMAGLFGLLSWIEIDVQIADAAGDLARRYRRSHATIDTTDYLIAAAAESIAAQLVTLNVRHFPMFEDLRPAYTDQMRSPLRRGVESTARATPAARRQQSPEALLFHDNQTFSSYSVDDVAAAKAFYGDTLGLELNQDDGNVRITLANGGMLYLYPKPNHEPASFTVLNFLVPDVEQAVDGLTAKGVVMEQYDMPEIKTDAKGIARDDSGAIAWFKDPAGNILSVLKM